MRRIAFRIVLACILSLAVRGIADAAEPAAEIHRIGKVAVLGDGPGTVLAGLGVFHLKGTRGKSTGMGWMEARIGKKWGFLGPVFGVLVNADGGVYGYGGIYSDFRVDPFVATVVLAGGRYRQGDSLDLGGPFQFREELSICYRFHDQRRIGVQFSHISNAGIYDANPGENDLLFVYGIPF